MARKMEKILVNISGLDLAEEIFSSFKNCGYEFNLDDLCQKIKTRLKQREVEASTLDILEAVDLLICSERIKIHVGRGENTDQNNDFNLTGWVVAVD